MLYNSSLYAILDYNSLLLLFRDIEQLIIFGLHSHENICDLAGFFTCFESFTIPYILFIDLTNFRGLTIIQDMRVKSFI